MCVRGVIFFALYITKLIRWLFARIIRESTYKRLIAGSRMSMDVMILKMSFKMIMSKEINS